MIPTFIRKFMFKRRYLRLLEQEAWRKEFAVAYDEGVIPDFEAMIQIKQDEANRLSEEFESGDPNDHTREARDRRKLLNEQIEAARREIENISRAIAAIRQAAATERQKAEQIKNRVSFVKKNL